MDSSIYHQFYKVEDRHWWFVGRRAIVDGFLGRIFGRGTSGRGGRSPGEAAGPAGSAPGAVPPHEEERRILDVGCGTGGMLPLLARYGRVTGVDSEPLALEYCRKRGIEDVHLQDAFSPGAPYDVITLFDVLEHVEDETGFLAVMKTWLKPDGRLVLTVPAFRCLWSRHDDLNRHQRRYTRKRLVAALEGAGFAPGRTSYFNTLLFPLAALSRLLDKRKPIEAGKDEEEILKPLRIGPWNGILAAIFALERHLLGVMTLPFGVSLFAEARPASGRGRDDAGGVPLQGDGRGSREP